jgi:hypothetical protein
MYNEIQNDTDESLLAELDAIDTERAERKSTAAERHTRKLYMREFRKKTDSKLKRLQKKWAEAFAQLPDDQRADYLKKQEQMTDLVGLMIDSIRGKFLYPDIIYQEIKESGVPIFGSYFSDADYAEYFAFDDGPKADQFSPDFEKYGLRLTIPESLYSRFLECVILYADKTGESDPQVLGEAIDVVERDIMALHVSTLQEEEKSDFTLYDILRFSDVGKAILKYRYPDAPRDFYGCPVPPEDIEDVQRAGNMPKPEQRGQGQPMTQKQEIEQTERAIRKSVLGHA